MRRILLAICFNLLGVSLYAQSYMLSYSTASSRAGGVALDGAMNLSGLIYVFTAPAGAPANFSPPNVKSVSYWLDNAAMTGSPLHTEFNTPYDFKNGSLTQANPWDTGSVSKGIHTITQLVTTTAGATEVDTATFGVGALATAPLALPFPGAGAGKGFTLTVNGTQIPSCGPADGDCSLTLQITDCNGNPATAVVAGCPVTLAIQKTASLPTPQTVTTILATVTTSP